MTNEDEVVMKGSCQELEDDILQTRTTPSGTPQQADHYSSYPLAHHRTIFTPRDVSLYDLRLLLTALIDVVSCASLLHGDSA